MINSNKSAAITAVFAFFFAGGGAGLSACVCCSDGSEFSEGTAEASSCFFSFGMLAEVDSSVSIITDVFSVGDSAFWGVFSLLASGSGTGASGAGSGGIDMGEGGDTFCTAGIEVSLG